MIRTSWIVEADGDENIPGSTQPSLGQNESTMERHVTTPFTQPSKQTSDRGTTPQTNSPGNTNSPSVNSQQPANMENPAMQAMDPEGNGNIIMQGSSRDYLDMIRKQANDSAIYHQGFEDGRAGKEMDKSLSNLSDDYFNGWQDGQIYTKHPIDEVEVNLIDMKPGSNALPHLMGQEYSHLTAEDPDSEEGQQGWHGMGTQQYDYTGNDTYKPNDPRMAGLFNKGPKTPRPSGNPTDELTGPTNPAGHTHLDDQEDSEEVRRKKEIQEKARGRFFSSIQICSECSSMRIAHCGMPGCADSEGNELGRGNPEVAQEFMSVYAFANCKGCGGSGVVCGDCGVPR